MYVTYVIINNSRKDVWTIKRSIIRYCHLFFLVQEWEYLECKINLLWSLFLFIFGHLNLRYFIFVLFYYLPYCHQKKIYSTSLFWSVFSIKLLSLVLFYSIIQYAYSLLSVSVSWQGSFTFPDSVLVWNKLLTNFVRSYRPCHSSTLLRSIFHTLLFHLKPIYLVYTGIQLFNVK